MVPEYELIDILANEAKSDVVPLHPQLGLLVQAFIRYLKEPRFQSPLTILELSELFRKFYQDLNTLTINVYSQSNSNKKQLISNSQHLKSCPELFDYLLAIANYSSSSIKLVKRTDPSALLQLRIFNFYKFIITFEMIEKALNMLFNSVNNNHEDVKLFDKIFRFDERDLIIQEFLDQKLLTLRKLKLSIESFIESSPVSNKVNELDLLNNETINQIHHIFLDINNQITPFAKLKVVVEVQKQLITFLSDHLDTEINNDILLPIFIYLTIYKFSNDTNNNKDSDLYLNFNFIKNFVNLIDPDNIPLVPNSNSVSFGSYNPDTCTIFTHNSTKQIPHKLISLFECLNLNADDSNDTESDIFFNSDQDLINFMQSHYLNNSELNYYLTNFEAVLFFIQSVTIDELSNVVKTNNPILLKPINKLVDEELMNQFRFPPGKAETKEPVEDQGQESDKSLKTPTLDTTTTQPNRSRSSSLFNTITNRLNDAATSVNRSRSNSALFNRKDSNGGGEFSIYPSPIIPNDSSGDSSTNLNMMRNILGRFGLVSLRPSESQFDEETGIADEDGTSGSGNGNGTINGTNATTNAPEEHQSKTDRLSPHQSLTRSSSLETQNISPNRKNTIASRLSTGVNEIMTKFNAPNNNIIINPVNNSTSSLKSIEEMDDQIGDNVNQEKRPEYLRSRTTSLQVMEKWFNNLATNPQQKQVQAQQNQQQHQQQHQNHQPLIPPAKGDDYISDSRTGSVFSTTSKELTKYHNVDFDCLTVLDLRTLKLYYDQLCNEVGVKLETKTSEEISHDQISTNSI